MRSSLPSLHTEIFGAGRTVGRPLVLLHGFTGDTTTWSRLIDAMGTERTIVAVDLIGHGASGAPDDPAAYTMETTVAAVRRATWRALGRASPRDGQLPPRDAAAHWLGYSMGGRVALQLALEVPDEAASLVLVGASPGSADSEARRVRIASDDALARLIETEGLEAFVDRWMAHPLFETQARLGGAHLAEARAQRLRNRPQVLAHTLRGMGTGAMNPLWDGLPELRVPTLLVNGAWDAKFDQLARSMAERMPAATRVVVPESGHAVHVEAPAELATAVESWLRQVDVGGGDV